MNSVIVCEGIHDEMRIKEVFPDAFCITTNGSEISKETLDMIKRYSLDHEIIIFTDPDHPGEMIRNKVLEVVPNASEAFLDKKVCISKNKKKVGIEHASKTQIYNALNNYIKKNQNLGTLTTSDLYELGLLGDDNAKDKREKLARMLNIGKPNGKTLLKRLNQLGYDYKKLQGLMKDGK